MMDYWKQEKYDHTTLKEKNLRDTIALMEAELGREAGKVDPASLVWATFRSHERREANADTPERWIPYRGAPNKVNGKMYKISQRHLDNFPFWQNPTPSDYKRNGITL